MKKRTLLCLTLVTMLLVSGCSMIEVDPAVDAKTVVAKVGDQAITKGESQSMYQLMTSQYAAYMGQYGSEVDLTDKEVQKTIKQATLDQLTEQIVLANQLKAQGLELTEEELQQAKESAKTNFEELCKSYQEAYFSVTTLDEEALRKTVEAKVMAEGYTLSFLEENAIYQKTEEKLRAAVIANVAVTDEEIQAEYDSRLAKQQETYTTTPQQFAADFVNHSSIYVRPEGYRFIKNLLIGMPEEVKTEIDTMQSTLGQNEYIRYQIEQQRTSLGEKITAEDQKRLEDMLAQANQSDEEAKAKIEEQRAKGLKAILAQAEEVLRRAKGTEATGDVTAVAPEDFGVLLAEVGSDAGMKTEPLQSNGYPVSKDTVKQYTEEFQDAAMGLEKPGDISELVATDFGYHILLYAADLPAGTVPLDEVKEVIKKDLLDARQEEIYTAKHQEWVDSANIKTWPEQL